MDDKSKINKLILKSAYVVIIVLIIAVIALLILKYEVEGEKNMPFKLSSIIIVSNAEGYQEEQNLEYKWDVEVYQINDIYLNIEKNKNYKETEVIKSIVIDNIQVNKIPQVGKIEIYRPSSDSFQTYSYKEEYRIEGKTEFIGDTSSDIKNLRISNQGNTIMFRILNKTGKKYKSNEEEFKHDGKLLEKVGINYEEMKSEIYFDLKIILESGISFKATVKLQLPVGDILKEGSSSLEITDMKNIVFKREQT